MRQLVLTFLCALLAVVQAKAEQFSTDDGVVYVVNPDGTSVTFSWCGNEELWSGQVTIPSTVTRAGKTYKVTSIGSSAFQGCTGLTSVTIPSSVRSIGNSAFSGLRELTSVTIGSGVTNIGAHAFNECIRLTSGVIPSSVTSIGYRAFHMCPLSSVEIANGVIGEEAFLGCSRMTSVKLGNGVTSIGARAFYGCSALTGALKIPDSVTSIGDEAFAGWMEGPNFTSLELGSGLTSIGDAAFKNCASLTGELKIPEGVTSIGEYAFYLCSGLTSVEFPEGMTSIGSYAFYRCSGLTSVEFPEGMTSIGERAFYGCSGLTSVEMRGVASIGVCAFEGCSGLTGELKLPSSVTSIGGAAFRDCSGLTGELKIPSGVTTIGAYAFSGCSGLTGELKIPSSVTSIGDETFKNCSGLTGELNIPSSVTNIGNSAFEGCGEFTGELKIPEGVTSIGERAFFGHKGFDKVSIPSSATNIGSKAFEYKDISVWVIGGSKAHEEFRDVFRHKIIYVDKGTTATHKEVYGADNLYIENDCYEVEVTVETPGTLIQEIVKAGAKLAKVTKLKVNGTLNEDDWNVINNSIPWLIGLDLSGVTNTEMPAVGRQYMCELKLPKHLREVPSNLLWDCNQTDSYNSKPYLHSIEIPKYVIKVGDYAYCSVDTVVFEGDLAHWVEISHGDRWYASIKNFVVNGSVDAVKELVVPEGVTKIMTNAFSNIKTIKSVILPNCVTSVGSNAFSRIDSLQTIDFGRGIKTIGANALANCGKLREITFGSQTESIDYTALSGDKMINKITCLSTTPPAVSQNFTDIAAANCKLYVPKSALYEYAIHPVWGQFDYEGIDDAKPSIVLSHDDGGKMTINKKTVNGNSIVETENGTTYTVRITPQPSHAIKNVYVNGEDKTDEVAKTGRVTVTGGTKDVFISAQFIEAPEVYGEGGSADIVKYDGSTLVISVRGDESGDVVKDVTVGEKTVSYTTNDDGTLTIEDVDQDAEVIVVFGKGNPTIVNTILAEGVESWCDMSGRKLAGKPTRMGVYVHNGKLERVK